MVSLLFDLLRGLLIRFISMLLRVEAQEPLGTGKFDGLALRLGRGFVPHITCAFAGELRATDAPVADLLPGTYCERDVFLPCQLEGDGKGNSVFDSLGRALDTRSGRNKSSQDIDSPLERQGSRKERVRRIADEGKPCTLADPFR